MPRAIVADVVLCIPQDTANPSVGHDEVPCLLSVDGLAKTSTLIEFVCFGDNRKTRNCPGTIDTSTLNFTAPYHLEDDAVVAPLGRTLQDRMDTYFCDGNSDLDFRLKVTDVSGSVALTETFNIPGSVTAFAPLSTVSPTEKAEASWSISACIEKGTVA